MVSDLQKDGDLNYNQFMQIKQEDEADIISEQRFEKERERDEKLLELKKAKIVDLEKELADIQAKFESNKEYQDNATKAEEVQAEIEIKYVEYNVLSAKVLELEQVRQMYEKIKTDELEEKKTLQERNAELKKEVETKEQMNRMRIQKRMNDTRNPEIKEMVVSSELNKEHIEDYTLKLQDEKEKFDKLLNERLEIDKQLELCVKDFEDHKVITDDQDTQIGELKGDIEVLEGEVKVLDETAVEDRKTNDKVEGVYRKLAQKNAALKAKLHFLKKNFDVTKNVKKLNMDDFSQLTTSNNSVNDSIFSFVEKLKVLKQQTTELEMTEGT